MCDLSGSLDIYHVQIYDPSGSIDKVTGSDLWSQWIPEQDPWDPMPDPFSRIHPHVCLVGCSYLCEYRPKILNKAVAPYQIALGVPAVTFYNLLSSGNFRFQLFAWYNRKTRFAAFSPVSRQNEPDCAPATGQVQTEPNEGRSAFTHAGQLRTFVFITSYRLGRGFHCGSKIMRLGGC